MNTAIIGIGSNINPTANIRKVRDILARDYERVGESAFVQTKPVGYAQQADFINGAVMIKTPLSQAQLKTELQEIETRLGRTRVLERYGPRTMDLDIVVWNDEIVDPDFHQRDFVKRAVLELMPQLTY